MRYVKISKFLEEKEQVSWLVEGLLPDVGWTLFYGLKGIGKTTFAIQLCEALQAGKPFLGRKTKKTRILFIQADSVALEWREILKRVSPKNDGFTVVDVPARCLGDNNHIASLKTFIQTINPGFIVWDSLYKLASDDINNAKILLSVEKMIAMCDDKPWMLIHHPPHGESRAAGSSSLGNTCSNEWCLLSSKLRIDKSRLTAEKELLLKRGKDNGGLWELHQHKVVKGESFMDREI